MWTWDIVIWWFRVMIGLWAVFLYFQNYFFYGCHDFIVQKLVEEKNGLFHLGPFLQLVKSFITLLNPSLQAWLSFPVSRHMQKASLPYLLLSCWRLKSQSQRAGIKCYCVQFRLETSYTEFTHAQ